MKWITYSGAVMAALCLAAGVKADPTADKTMDAAMAEANRAMSNATVEINKAVQKQLKLAQDVRVDANVDTQFADRLQSIVQHGPGDTDAFTWFPVGAGGGGASSPARGMVICFSEAEPKTVADGEEDLNIMSRILEKAATLTSEDEEQRQAMGIRLFTMGNGDGARNLLIEGYGAIFMLKVHFPLTGPTGKADDDTAKQPTNSAWDETKRELYGHPAGDGGGAVARQEYDPKQVEKLKDALLMALKNASNIRNLKSDESVTLVVTSGEGNSVMQPRMRKLNRSENGSGSSGSSSGSGGGGVTIRVSSSGLRSTGGGVLTIRARKSEIDAFAKGKLSLEEFRSKASVLVY